MADNDSQIDLKKRARRRLVGSAALALAARGEFEAAVLQVAQHVRPAFRELVTRQHGLDTQQTPA